MFTSICTLPSQYYHLVCVYAISCVTRHLSNVVQSEGRQGNYVEMTEVTLKSEPEVGTIDQGNGQATPAIIVEPPTLVRVLTDVGPDAPQGFDFSYKFGLGIDQNEMFVNLTLADSKPTPVDNHAQPLRSVLNLQHVSPPQLNEVHHTAMNVKKIDLWSISPPPPSFNMQVIQQELRRLTQDHTEVQEKLQEHKAKSDAVDKLFAYVEHLVQKHEVDPSAIFNDSPTLSERLAALEDITKRLEQEELTPCPLLEKVSGLETLVFLQEHESTIIIRVLENKWEVTLAALEERLTKAIGTLTAWVNDVEKSLMTMVSTVTAVSEQHLKLSSRQSTLEQLIIQ
ncbi:hypothetical protein K443DRAFT_13128 [Laccaria amethystina LaAM-08-1]|uniref:Uncharacterized protein n=1 Tax=Laccaria amethystina LaAM-08-1 TaxID=1095629 RepID=A0A0C9X620_9AGAR|nr:hypothetical protein K443DRAFT_13128 [Laccaria amethystina LaAM-08-1]